MTKFWTPLRVIVCVMTLCVTTLAPTADASPDIYECPYSHAHVWRPDQCPPTPTSPQTGGGGRCGAICGLGKVLGGLGGLL